MAGAATAAPRTHRLSPGVCQGTGSVPRRSLLHGRAVPRLLITWMVSPAQAHSTLRSRPHPVPLPPPSLFLPSSPDPSSLLPHPRPFQPRPPRSSPRVGLGPIPGFSGALSPQPAQSFFPYAKQGCANTPHLASSQGSALRTPQRLPVPCSGQTCTRLGASSSVGASNLPLALSNLLSAGVARAPELWAEAARSSWGCLLGTCPLPRRGHHLSDLTTVPEGWVSGPLVPRHQA